MDAVALAQQAEAQNATALLLAAINAGLLTIDEANNLTPEQFGEIGILETQEQVDNYLFRLLRETPVQRAARREQEREALNQLRINLRDQVQARADARANIYTTAGKRRRRRTRKSRKY